MVLRLFCENMGTQETHAESDGEIDRSWIAWGIVATGGGVSGLYWLLTKHLYSEGYLTSGDARLAVGIATIALAVMLLFGIILAENEFRRKWGGFA